MTEEPYLPAPSQSPVLGPAPESVAGEGEEYSGEGESYQERTSGTSGYTDSYDGGSGTGPGYRIPYRLMREGQGSPPPQPTHQAPGLPPNYSKFSPRTILVETSHSQARRPSYVSSVCVQPTQWRQEELQGPGRGHSSHW